MRHYRYMLHVYAIGDIAGNKALAVSISDEKAIYYYNENSCGLKSKHKINMF